MEETFSISVWYAVVILSLTATFLALVRQSFHLTRELQLKSKTFVNSYEISQLLLPEDDEKVAGRGHGERCRALDAFRGIILCLMVFVNYGGGGFTIFTHSVWDGLSIADVVFPWFAWMMGFSVFLSSSGRRHSFRRTIQRAAKLFALGLFVNNGDSWSEWRIPGVLQALSVAYLVVAVAAGCLPFPGKENLNQHRLWWFVAKHLIFGILPLISVNLLVTFALHVPGCPTGYIGPGGLADHGMYQNCTGGTHLYVDKLVFGRHHIFQTPTCQQRYQTGPYDPEGLLNWLMVAATSYIGYVQAALFTRAHELKNLARSNIRKIQQCHLFVTGSGLALLSIVSGGLWLFPNGPWIPLNKNLWSLSYMLLCSSFASLVFAILVSLVDGRTGISWHIAPFISVGKNSIAVYVTHEICQHFAPFAAKPVHAGDQIPQLELILFNLVGVATWVVVAQWMDLKKIFIRV